jgi:hypothetical protein
MSINIGIDIPIFLLYCIGFYYNHYYGVPIMLSNLILIAMEFFKNFIRWFKNFIRWFKNFIRWFKNFIRWFKNFIRSYMDVCKIQLCYDYFTDELNNTNLITNTPITNENDQPKPPPPKYEDKYLDSIRRLNKEWTFTEEETAEIINITNELFDKYKKNIQQENNEKIHNINNLKMEIIEDIDDEDCCEEWNNNNGNNCVSEGTTLEIRTIKRTETITRLQEECNKFEIDTQEGFVDLNIQSNNEATQTIITKKLTKLENSYIMETTPVGNVLMIYDVVNATFKYYSDGNIPYKYLEVVGRKYVKVFNCRPIFVDMEEEIMLFKEKEKEKEKQKKEKEEETNKLSEKTRLTQKPVEKKKNVFAKFKTYNKDVGNKISMAAAPPKNSIPNKNITENVNTKLILKDNANRYTYAGKYANFNFLKKVDKKVCNKKLGLSFADFKKMNQNK